MSSEGGAPRQVHVTVVWTSARRSGRNEEVSRNLFVGGLSWNTNDQGLSDTLAQFKKIIEPRVILDSDRVLVASLSADRRGS